MYFHILGKVHRHVEIVLKTYVSGGLQQVCSVTWQHGVDIDNIDGTFSCSGVTTDPADPAMRGGGPRPMGGPKIMALYIFD